MHGNYYKEVTASSTTVKQRYCEHILWSKATPEQSKDMLTFREIGMQANEQYVTHRILQSPSLNAPVRRHRLLTMARRKMSKKRVSKRKNLFKWPNACGDVWHGATVLNCHTIQVMSSTHFSLGLWPMNKATPIKHPRVTGQIN